MFRAGSIFGVFPLVRLTWGTRWLQTVVAAARATQLREALARRNGVPHTLLREVHR